MKFKTSFILNLFVLCSFYLLGQNPNPDEEWIYAYEIDENGMISSIFAELTHFEDEYVCFFNKSLNLKPKRWSIEKDEVSLFDKKERDSENASLKFKKISSSENLKLYARLRSMLLPKLEKNHEEVYFVGEMTYCKKCDQIPPLVLFSTKRFVVLNNQEK